MLSYMHICQTKKNDKLRLYMFLFNIYIYIYIFFFKLLDESHAEELWNYLKSKFWNQNVQFCYLHHFALSNSLSKEMVLQKIIGFFWGGGVGAKKWNLHWNACFLNVFNMGFEFLQQKPYNIIYKFRQNTIFEPETCEIRLKVGNRTCPDLPRPVQEDP